MAVGAFSRDVAVGQECLGFFIVVLLAFFFYKLAFIVECSKELGSRFFVYGTRRATINIEADAEGFKGFFNGSDLRRLAVCNAHGGHESLWVRHAHLIRR